jgi:hypothetical protein
VWYERVELKELNQVEAERAQERPAKRGRIRKKEEKENPEEKMKKREQVRFKNCGFCQMKYSIRYWLLG